MASRTSSDIDTVATGPHKVNFRQRMDELATFIWNSDTGECLGRSGKSWGQIFLFYIVFYVCLGGFFAAMMAAFYETLDWNFPKLQGPDSLLKGNPGLGFRPMPSYDSTLIRYVKGDSATTRKYIDHIESFIQFYENKNQQGENYIDCSTIKGTRQSDDRNKVCRFDIGLLGENCVKQQNYGFDDGMPCILLKLNKLFNWEPEPYTNDSLPDEISDLWDPYHVTVKCEGENPADEENMGTLEYWPKNGFPYKYFPFLNQQGYRAPIVMVQFTKPMTGVVIMLECKAWARNIRHDRLEKAGSIHFEILID